MRRRSLLRVADQVFEPMDGRNRARIQVAMEPTSRELAAPYIPTAREFSIPLTRLHQQSEFTSCSQCFSTSTLFVARGAVYGKAGQASCF